MKQNRSIDYQTESDGLVNARKRPFFEFFEILTRYTWISLMSRIFMRGHYFSVFINLTAPRLSPDSAVFQTKCFRPPSPQSQ